ncbi:hypothetical protein MHYP_G00139400 [Metynnis hypsauchen]
MKFGGFQRIPLTHNSKNESSVADFPLAVMLEPGGFLCLLSLASQFETHFHPGHMLSSLVVFDGITNAKRIVLNAEVLSTSRPPTEVVIYLAGMMR